MWNSTYRYRCRWVRPRHYYGSTGVRAFCRTATNSINNKDNFTIKRTTIRGKEVVKANFVYNNFEFEFFGQAQPVHKQNAYLHMIIEHKLLQKFPNHKEKVINLKKQGYKTEPAFCKLLDITGDPYVGLIRLGDEEGIVTDVF